MEYCQNTRKHNAFGSAQETRDMKRGELKEYVKS